MFATVMAFFLKRSALIGLALLAVAFGVQHLELSSARHTISSMNAAQKLAEAEIRTQNAAMAAQSSRSSAALAEAGKQVAAVAPRAAHFASQSAALGVYKPQGADRCGMLEDAVLEARKLFQ